MATAASSAPKSRAVWNAAPREGVADEVIMQAILPRRGFDEGCQRQDLAGISGAVDLTCVSTSCCASTGPG
ncbi:MAG: hypothetical protein ACK559_27960, partial [bacterium]